MKLWILLFTICILSIHQANAQENALNKSLKIYTNFSFDHESTLISVDTVSNKIFIEENNTLQIGYFTPAFTISTLTGSYHEIEISQLRMVYEENKNLTYAPSDIAPTTGGRLLNLFVAMRYEYNRILKQSNDSKIIPYLGVGIQPYYELEKFYPYTSLAYPVAMKELGVHLTVTPRLIYSINERLYLDLNLPYHIIEGKYRVDRIDDPTISSNKRSTTTSELNIFPPKYMLRVGAGIRI